MKKYFFILALFLAACKPEMPQVPSDVLTPQQMREVMVDIHIADALAQTKAQAGGNEQQLTESYYKVVFKKFNITEDKFRRSYKYYESHPAWMNRIYDGVMTDLSKKEAEESKQ
ncbi:MAG: DUF4296 domain-containing protein [Chitinophagales bacterium]